MTYLNPDKENRDGIMNYKLIYNHYLGPSSIDYIEAGAYKKLAHCTYTGEKRNCNLNKYATLHREKHNILDILK